MDNVTDNSLQTTSDVTIENDSLYVHEDAYYYYYGYENYEYQDHIYRIFDYETILFGYAWPVLVIFTSLCNILVIAGFLRRRMRTPTNLILVSIAISDSLTGLVTLPATFYVYAGNHEILTKDWCNINMITRLYIARAFHTVSVWQTLLLGIHRFSQIRYPTRAQVFCTYKKTLISIGVVYIMSFVLHSYHAFNSKTTDGFCQWTVEIPCGWTCVYIWCALLFGHILPCFFLLVLAVFMIKTVRAINVYQMTSSTRRKSDKNRNFTIVVVLIVVIFLIPELPYGIFYLIVVSQRHSGNSLFPLRTNRMIHCIYEILLVISFHLNFWVYCILVRSFRSCLKGLLKLLVCEPVNFSRLEGDVTTSSSKGLELDGVETEAAVNL